MVHVHDAAYLDLPAYLCSVLLLPGFWYLCTPDGERRLTALTDVLAWPGAIWLLALPIVLVDVVFGAAANGGWQHQTFALFLCCGYLLAADARLALAMGRGWRSALVVALVLMVIYAVGAFYLSDVAGVDPTRDYDLGSLAWRGLKSVGAWDGGRFSVRAGALFRERRALLHRERQGQAEAYQVMPDEELLEVWPVRLTLDLKALISRNGVRAECEVCGEEIINEREVVGERGIQAEVEKVTDYAQMMRWNIMQTPGLVVDDVLVSSGRIPNEDEIAGWLVK